MCVTIIRPFYQWCTSLQKLARQCSGTATIEFAIILPAVLTLGLFGTETAHRAIANMQVSQLALSIADNASRLGQTDNTAVTPTITEADVNSVMFGALEQGKSIGLEQNGRVILSSLERDPDTGFQYIHWQRCTGELEAQSDYGLEQPDGPTDDSLEGMGTDNAVTASDGVAVMYVEVEYTYQPVFDIFGTGNQTIRQEAAFVVRDDRNLIPGVTGSGEESSC